MTVRELIALLQTFPEDAYVAACLDAQQVVVGSKVEEHLPFSGATTFMSESLSDMVAGDRDRPAEALFLEVREPFRSPRLRPSFEIKIG